MTGIMATCAILISSCAQQDDNSNGLNDADEPSSTPENEQSSESSDPPAEGKDEDSASDDPQTNGTDATNDEDPAEDNDDLLMEDFQSEGIDIEAEERSALGEVVDVRVGSHNDFQRIVIEFSGEEPPNTYMVDWTDETTVSGSGEELDVAGDEAMIIRVNGTSTDTSDLGDEPIEVHEPLIIGDHGPLLEVHSGSGYQDESRYYLGLEYMNDFRVEALNEPSRLVIDILN